MPIIATHDHFMNCLDAFLKKVASLTGMSQPKDQNMLQFVIGLGSGTGPTDLRQRPPLKIEFRDSQESPMKTILHVLEPDFTNAQAQRIAGYFNHKHGANVASVTHVPYLKGNHESVEVLSGALVDELDVAKDHQDMHRAALVTGKHMFLGLPISDRAKAELQSPQAMVDFTPDPKRGMRHQAVTFSGVSDETCQEIISAITQRYGKGSVSHVQ